MSAITEHSTLDVLLNDSIVFEHFDISFVYAARAELADLRASIEAQAQRIAELENDVICAFCGAHYRADDVPPEHWRTCAQSPLVRQLSEARQCITRRIRYHRNYPPQGSVRWYDRANGIPGEYARECDCDYCIEDRAWLAANPAPQAEQSRHAVECPCVAAEKPVRPCSYGCWHFSPYDSGHQCANCGQPPAPQAEQKQQP